MGALFYLFLLVCAGIGIGIYLLFIVNLVPGAKEERLGVLEPLPDDVGRWKEDRDSDAARAAEREGLVREVRHYFYEDRGRLVQQARYRNPETREIVRVEPERIVKRKRIRA